MSRPAPADFHKYAGWTHASQREHCRCGSSTLMRWHREAGHRSSVTTASESRAAMLAQPRVSRDPCARCGVPEHNHAGERHAYVAKIGTRF